MTPSEKNAEQKEDDQGNIEDSDDGSYSDEENIEEVPESE